MLIPFLAALIAASPAGQTAADRQVPAYDHVIVIMEENKNYEQIMSPQAAPNIARLAAEYGTADQFFAEVHPIEANYDLLNGIDFRKGCFVGQETTSRMKRRGTVKSRILPFTSADVTAGDEVLNGTLRAGEVLAAADGVGLGLFRLDRLDGELSVHEHGLEVTIPNWIEATPPSTGQS